MNKKNISLAAIFVICIIAGAWFFSNHSQHAQHVAADVEAEETETAKKGAVDVDEVPVVTVQSKHLSRNVVLPAELRAFRDVDIHAKVPGFVKIITVDRGSVVRKGQLLIKLMAPEIEAECSKANAALESCKAQYTQALSKLASSRARLEESKAKLAKDAAVHERLLEAAKVPGTISGNELDKSAKDVDFDKAHVQSMTEELDAAKAMVHARSKQVNAAEEEYKAMASTMAYLTISAPFDGVITERNVHEGSLVGEQSSRASSSPALKIQQVAILRLVVYVPEDDASGIEENSRIKFSVKAHPGRKFAGIVRRIGHDVDRKTRTMPVELDVINKDRLLEPGMFADVFWPEHRPYNTLFVPSTAVVQSLSGDFVIKVADGKTTKVKVSRGKTDGKLQEIFGDLKEGDRVLLHGSEEIESGTALHTRVATNEEIKEFCG